MKAPSPESQEPDAGAAETSTALDVAPLLAALPIGIAVIRGDGTIEARNAAAANLLTGSGGRVIRPALERMHRQIAASGGPVEATVSDIVGDLRLVVDRAGVSDGSVATIERQVARKLAQEVRALRTLMRALRNADAPGLSQSIERAVMSLGGLLGRGGVRVYERRPAPDRLVCILEHGLELELPREVPLPGPGERANAAVAHAVVTETPVFISQPYSRSALAPAHEGAAGADQPPRTALALPLTSRGAVFGAALVIIDRQTLADGDLRLLLGFCDTVAVLMERARAAEHVAQVRDHITRTERLATLGRLTAGIVHEINNPLSGLVISLALMEEMVDEIAARDNAPEEAEEMRKLLTECDAMIDRLKELMSAVRGTSRDGATDDIPFDPGRAVRDAVRVFAAAKHSACRVELDLPPLPALKGSPSRLGQVILNLLENGLAAMDHSGRLVVRAETADGQVRLMVVDQGCGIPPENQPHVFEPFFTTKPIDQGTGLGLSICRDIITAMRGTITFETSPAGTAFIVDLPAHRLGT